MLLFVKFRFAYIALNKVSYFINRICQHLCNINSLKLMNRNLNVYCKTINGLRALNDDFIKYVLKKEKGIHLQADKILTIAFRGSGADYGVVGTFDNKIYNLGLTSSDLYAAYYIYLSKLKSLPQLKNIVLFYSVSCCGLDLIKTTEKYRQLVYSNIFNFPLPSDSNLNSKYVRYIQDKVKSVAESNLIDISSQYWGYETKSSYMDVSANVRISSHMRENHREPNQLCYLKELAEALQNDKRYLYIVLPPYRKDYLSLLPPKEVLYKSLYAMDLPKNSIIIDLHDSVFFNDSDFGDTDHMSHSGAEKLTNCLLEYLK